nr:hypothetical protein [Tanacetum cinerariifolium]
MNKESTRRNVHVKTTNSLALISQCDGLGYYWCDQVKEGLASFALMTYSSTSLSSSRNFKVSNDLNSYSSYIECVKDLKEQNEQLVKDLRTARVSVVSYKTGLESVEARLLVFKKNKSVYEEDIKLLKREIYLRDLDITELKRKLELATKEKDEGNPQQDLNDKGIIDSGCSRHMTGKRSYLTNFEEIDGGFVAFGGNPRGKITRKDFKLTDESYMLLKVPRKDNMYIVDLKNFIPQGGLTCLFAKATSDESNHWHRRLRHVNFKTINKLVKGNLFCEMKGIKSLATKDETSGILKTFVTCIENLINLRVKVIRCDNGTELKNMVMNQFCEMKGIKMKFSVARTPPQNRAEAINTNCYVKNRVLIIKPHNKTPHGLFLVRKPALSFMRPFGCPVRILNTIDHLGKFDGKDDEGFFVGYSIDSKAFRVFNSRTRIVEESLHTQDPPFSSSLKNSLGARFKQSGEEENKDVEDPGNEDSEVSSTKEPRINQEKDSNDNSTNNIYTTQDPPFSSSLKNSLGARFKQSGEEENKDVEDLGNEDSEVLSTKEPRVNQEKDLNDNSTNNINTVSPTDNAACIKDNVVDENIVYGSADDPNIPNLEEIDRFYDVEDEDSGGDLKNLDTNF